MEEWCADPEMGWDAERASGHRRGMSSLWWAGWTSAKSRCLFKAQCNIKVMGWQLSGGGLTV